MTRPVAGRWLGFRELTQTDLMKHIRAELKSAGQLTCMHGITLGNIEAFLVPPFLASVCGESDSEQSRQMWIVLHEFPEDPKRGYSIGYDPHDKEWLLVEVNREGKLYSDTYGGASFIEAVNNM